MDEETSAPHILLKRAREKHGWTQAQLAEKMNVEDITISRWERAERIPRSSYRRRLQSLLRIPMEIWVDQSEEDQEIVEGSRTLREDEMPYPDIWTIPFLPRLFVGREDVLLRLHDTFFSEQTAELTQAVSGLGGIGKTITALRYAYKYRGEYKAVFWIDASTRDNLIAGLIGLASELNLSERRSKDREKILRAVGQWMKDHAYWLLILDNIEDTSLVYEFIPSAKRGHLLLTSRVQSVGDIATNIELNGLSQEDGALLLLQKARVLPMTGLLNEASENDQTNAKYLSFLMEGLPLSLDQAGAYIREQSCSVVQYLELFQNRQAEILRWRSAERPDGPYTYPHAVATTWSLSFDKIWQASITAVDLLSFYCFLAPDAIPDDLVLSGASELGQNLSLVTNHFDLLNVIHHLRKYSFVQRDTERQVVIIHRLVQAVFRDRMGDIARHEWASRTVRAFYKAFHDSEKETLHQRERFVSHAKMCLEWIKNEKLLFRDAEQLVVDVGHYLRLRSSYTEAETFFQQALNMIQQMRAPRHPDRAAILNNMALLYKNLGQLERAQVLFEESISIFEESMPEASSSVVSVLVNTAMNLLEWGELVRAEQYCLQVMRLLERWPDDPRTLGIVAPCTSTLATIYRDQHKYEESIANYQKALAICEKLHGKDSLEVARELNNLASVYICVDKFVEAEQLNLRALDIFERIQGPVSTDVASCLSCLSDSAFASKDWLKVEQFNTQAIEIYVQLGLFDHHKMVQPLGSMAVLMVFQRKNSEAEKYFKQALSIAEKYPPAITRDFLWSYSMFLKVMGRLEEFENLVKKFNLLEFE